MPRKPIVIAVLLVALVAAPARASQLVTWTTTSRFVDPSKVAFNTCPPGAPQPPRALPVEVLLPDGYDPRRRYPVLYLLHGHGDCYFSWASDRGRVAQIAKGFPGIIVMPEGGRGWYTNWWSGGARSPAWESYHLDELIPLVERRLPIARGRANHAIAGLSMGGEGAMYYAEQRPGYFGAPVSRASSTSCGRSGRPRSTRRARGTPTSTATRRRSASTGRATTPRAWSPTSATPGST